MKKQITIEKALYKDRLCPFEEIKTWKSGLSIRCADHVWISHGKGSEDDSFILHRLEIKRSYDCKRCLAKLAAFEQTWVNSPVPNKKSENE